MFVEGVEALHARLAAYIEAVYHVADSRILEQRAALLHRDGVIRQPAFIESTMQYQTGAPFARLLDGAPAALMELVARLSGDGGRLLHDPPYAHQGEALRALLFEGRDIVVFTGTGSGKTECFTIPILMRLLREAADAPNSFQQRAMRAIVLYPMNALVNDQLGRMRHLFGSDEVADAFDRAAGRPVTFGQYTGRTPFPGVRRFTADTDGRRMESFSQFFIKTVLEPALSDPPDQDALLLLNALNERGRWPKKPDLLEWFGTGRWEGRLHPRPDDRELIARHEFYGYVAPDGTPYGGPPDVLITNYSMLEYMLMRPIERSLFDRTREWLDQHRDQEMFLVLDEAHLYRGAQGTEVALLIRRLQERLGLAHPTRAHQLRVAVTSASFSGAARACEFAGALVGRSATSFVPIAGSPSQIDGGVPGAEALATGLAAADMLGFYAATTTSARYAAVRPALEALGPSLQQPPQAEDGLSRAAYDALVDHPVRRHLVAMTRGDALQLTELSARLFPDVPSDLARRATATLTALCAFAKPGPDASNLLPSRIHTFHRGLPGLWACANPACEGVTSPAAVIGALFSQPRDTCDHCGARVLEFMTCRSCGAAYLRGACGLDEIGDPTFLWARTVTVRNAPVVVPVDVLLEVERSEPEFTDRTWMDPQTGALFPAEREGLRPVGLYKVDPARAEPLTQDGRRFYRCGVCGDNNDLKRGEKVTRRSPVEDHQTEGQEPFYALVHEQLMRQPGRPRRPEFLKRETSLGGRKVLIFSDGRQKAARLAAELGRSALRDSLRPLTLAGFRVAPQLTLRHLYPAVLLGAAEAGVELRATDESFDRLLRDHVARAKEAIEDGLDEPDALDELKELTPAAPIATLLLRLLRDKHTGVQALALARIAPAGRARRRLRDLPALPGTSPQQQEALLSLWLGSFVEQYGCTAFEADALEDNFRWLGATAASGALKGIVAALTTAYGREVAITFKDEWLPIARDALRSDSDDEGGDKISMNASRLTLQIGAPEQLASWFRCSRCSRVQPAALDGAACVHCPGSIEALTPESEPARRFLKRKGFYRSSAASGGPSTARPLVAREHSAALTGVSGDVQSRAERHELAFQDITAESIDGMRSSIDVLSCTTTMEVGIDIGDLSAVALRNMPPGRANYQQRAGRAGRRGNAVATVLAYADQDGHNQHFFENPRKLIKSPVPDPTLNLENPRIAQRHVNAFVLQSFLAEALPATTPADSTTANLFASLGTVAEFFANGTPFNSSALRAWLTDGARLGDLRGAVDRWLPAVVRGRADLLATFHTTLLASLERLRGGPGAATADTEPLGDDGQQEDVDAEVAPTSERSLLEQLLYKGVLPKYAFPTDLVAFHVFEATNGLNAKPSAVRGKVRYAPQRGLSLALSEYAPGRTVFIDGRAWMSGALFSPLPGAVGQAFAEQEYFRTCAICGHASLSASSSPTGLVCPSCGDNGMATAIGMKWIRPPGFAHPVTFTPRTEPDAMQYSRPGRAVLWAQSPPSDQWTPVAGGISQYLGYSESWEVVVTNQGPRDQGFRVCRRCGAIEPSTEGRLTGAAHRQPFPSARGMSEPCPAPELDTVCLGTKFRTDVLLMRFMLPADQAAPPGAPNNVFAISASSLATAMALAATLVLEIEADEVIAGYRSSIVNAAGQRAVEIFLYDQLAGGAGYVVELSARIGELLEATRAILSHQPWAGRTPQPPCDRACYGCLLSFKNSFEHASLDRLLALDLLDAAASGAPAAVGPARTARALDALERWLRLLGRGEVAREVTIDGVLAPLSVRRPDGRYVVPALCHPFSPDQPDDGVLRDLAAYALGAAVEVVAIDQSLVAQALPLAMRDLRVALGE